MTHFDMTDGDAARARSALGPVSDPRDDRAADRADAVAADCFHAVLADEWSRGAVGARLATLAGLRAQADAAGRAANLLGEAWVDDTASFADVTLGLHRLTLALLDLEAANPPARLHGGRVLLAAMPGDQHGFGLATVALGLRAGGWDVTLDLSGVADRLVAAARRPFDCIGLSIGHDRALVSAAALVRRLRAARPTARIAVGGPMRGRVPDLAAATGADLCVVDGFALAAALAPPPAMAA